MRPIPFDEEYPPREWTRLQKLVWTLIHHGNSPANLNLETLARHNSWTDAEQLLVEFKIQQNGQRKLPEEAAVETLPVVQEFLGDGK